MINAYKSLQTNKQIDSCENIGEIRKALDYVQLELGLNTEEKMDLYDKLMNRKQQLARKARSKVPAEGGRRTRKRRSRNRRTRKH